MEWRDRGHSEIRFSTGSGTTMDWRDKGTSLLRLRQQLPDRCAVRDMVVFARGEAVNSHPIVSPSRLTHVVEAQLAHLQALGPV